MRIVTYKLALLIAVMGTAPVLATDFTRFLGAGSVTPTTDDKAVDESGQEYRVSTGSQAELYSRVGTSILSEATGVPNVPVYPTLLLKNGAWVPAVARPMTLLTIDVKPERLNGRQLGELTSHLMMNWMLGRKPGMDGIVFTSNGHYATQSAGPALTGFVDDNGPKLGDYFASLPDRIAHMNASDKAEFARTLTELLSKLDRMEPSEFEKTLGPAIEALERERAKAGKPPFDFRRELKRRVETVRMELSAALQARKVSKSVLEEIATADRAIPRPHINIPGTRLDSVPPPVLSRRNAPVDMLWGYFFTQDTAKRDAAAPKAVVDGYLAKAKDDQSRIYEVMPHMRPGSTFLADEIAQTTLNPRNPKTLVVVPVNDEEAREIETISKRANVHVQAVSLPHGSKMDDSLAHEIKKYARKHGIERVIVVELPGKTPDVEASIRDAGLDLIIVDHHDYKDLDRHHPLSSLEQTAQHLGYKLSPESKAIGVMDRSLIFGLADLGIPREMIRRYAQSDSGLADRERLQVLPTNKGMMHVSRGFYGGLKDLVASLAEKHYPAIPNVLVFYHDSIRFSGSPDYVAKLQEIVRPYEAALGKEGAHFSGGDTARSMFWGVKIRNPEIMEAIVRQVAQFAHDETIKPPPNPEDVDPHYPPSTPPAGWKPPLVVGGVVTRPLKEILDQSSPMRVRILEYLRWESLTKDQREQLLLVANELTEKEEVNALGKLVRYAHDKDKGAWAPFMKKYDDIQPPWSIFNLGQEPSPDRPAVTTWVRPIPVEKPPEKPPGPPENSGIAATLAEIRADLAKALEERKPAPYIALLDKYLQKCNVAWDFIELIKYPGKERPYSTDTERDRWIEKNFTIFLALKPTMTEMAALIDNFVYQSETRVKLRARAAEYIRTAPDLIALVASSRNHRWGYSPEKEAMDALIKKHIHKIFSTTSPTGGQLDELGRLFGGDNYYLVENLLPATKTPEQFDTVLAANPEYSKPVFSSGIEGLALHNTKHFLAMSPSVEQMRQVMWRFRRSATRNAYLTQTLNSVKEASDFASLVEHRQPPGAGHPTDEKQRSDAIYAALGHFFDLEYSTDLVKELVKNSGLHEDARLEVIRMALDRADSTEEIADLAVLRNDLLTQEGHWRFVQLLESHRRRFMRLKPKEAELATFTAFTSKDHTTQPGLADRCSFRIANFWKDLRGQ